MTMSHAWPFTARGTGALLIATGCFIAATQLGLVELVYFGVLLVAAVAAGWHTWDRCRWGYPIRLG